MQLELLFFSQDMGFGHVTSLAIVRDLSSSPIPDSFSVSEDGDLVHHLDYDSLLPVDGYVQTLHQGFGEIHFHQTSSPDTLRLLRILCPFGPDSPDSTLIECIWLNREYQRIEGPGT
jgi:hypothetical protein